MMPSFFTLFGLAFVLLCGLMFFAIVVRYWPQVFDEQPADFRRYKIQDYDGVWFECTREEWIIEKTRSDRPSRRSKILPVVQSF